MNIDATANLLGALALTLADRIRAATEATSGHTGETPAALTVLGMEPGLSNDGLRHILRLSHPGTVRLVDRLAADGLVERRPARDGRAVALHLTTAGEARRDTLLASRQGAIQALLEGLTRDEIDVFGALLQKILSTSFAADQAAVLNVCRLCNTEICDHCPFEPET